MRYNFPMRPGGGTADASVSKTDIERCVGSNPTPGTITNDKGGLSANILDSQTSRLFVL